MTDRSDRVLFTSSFFAEGRRLKGTVQLAGQQTARNGELVEVDPAAFVKADLSKAVLAVGHQAFADPSLGYDPLRTVAKIENGSLRVTRTEQGFAYETDELPNTTYANDLLELSRSKDGKAPILGGTSFDIFGLRSTFKAAPDGTRIRRYTSIGAIGAITPVVEPAFQSTVAAFSKENDVVDTIDKPEADEAEASAKRERAKFAGSETAEQPAKTPKDEWQAFAADLSTEQITGQMDAIFAAASGDLKGEMLDRYEGFAAELQTRKRSDADTKSRIERMTSLHNARLGRLPKAPETGEVFASQDYKTAFVSYLRTGNSQVMEQFAQSIAGDGSEGGYTVPEDFRLKIVERLKAFGGVSKYAEELVTSDGRPLPWPTNDDTGNTAAIATEGSAVGSGGADLVFGELALGAFSYDATGTSNLPLAVSKELIQDSAFDIEAFVSRKLGERLGRKMAADFATGNGSGKPKGLFDKSADVMSATTMYAACVEHLLQVDQAYRESGNCRWLMSDTTFAKVLGSVDDAGRPLFQPSASSGAQASAAGFILGYPLSLDQGAGDLVAFGDINAGYVVRRVRGVTVDVDPYTLISKRQIAFHAWARADGQIQDSYAVSVSTYASVSADT